MTGDDDPADDGSTGEESPATGTGPPPTTGDESSPESADAHEDASAAERALRELDAAALQPDGAYAVTTTVFDATVAVADDPAHYRVTVRTPTLDAAVADAVADVVETDWYETFALRVRDPPSGVARSVVGEPDVARGDDEVVVTATLDAADATRAAADAKALVEFVEGTWVQGVVPGYEYVGPAAGLLSRARQRAEGPGP